MPRTAETFEDIDRALRSVSDREAVAIEDDSASVGAWRHPETVFGLEVRAHVTKEVHRAIARHRAESHSGCETRVVHREVEIARKPYVERGHRRVCHPTLRRAMQEIELRARPNGPANPSHALAADRAGDHRGQRSDLQLEGAVLRRAPED